MRAAWFVAATQVRRRWGSVVVLTLIVGITGAVVLASLAGARRTSTAVSRFEDETLSPDLTVFLPPVDAETIDTLRSLRGVEAIGVARQLMATVDGRFSSAVGGPLDENLGRTVDHVRVLEGRRARPGRIREVAIPEGLAEAGGLSLGDSVVLHGFTPEQVEEVFATDTFDVGRPEGPRVELRVVGITRGPSDLSFEGTGGGVMFTTRAFADRYADEIGSFSSQVLRVRTTDAASARRFVKQARARTADVPGAAEGQFQVLPVSETEGAVRESIDVVAQGLLVFAIVAALAGVVVVVVVIRRFVDGGADDLEPLRALGVPQHDRALALALGAMPVAVAGSVVAVVGAWLASPLMPLGLARKAEPHAGLDFDPLVLGVGWLAGVALVGLLALWAGRSVVRSARTVSTTRTTPPRTSRTSSLPPAVAIGINTVVDPRRGRGSTSPWPSIGGVLVAVIGLVAIGVVAASMRNLEHEPRVYGYNWDAHAIPSATEGGSSGAECDPAATRFVDDAAIRAAAILCSEVVEVDGYPVSGIGLEQLKQRVTPTVVEGREARRPDEVALATKTLDRVDASIGDTVTVAGPGGEGRYRVVGRVVLPSFTRPTNEDSDVQAIADGAAFTGDGLQRLSQDDLAEPRVLLRWEDGADVEAAAERIEQSGDGETQVKFAIVPLEVDRIEQLHVLPWLLGAFIALIGVLGVGYGLVMSVARRNRDLAVLRTIGFRDRQVMGSIATEATIYAALGLLVGVPVGFMIGRAAWDEIAASSGFDVVPILSWWFLAVVIVGTLVATNAVAWFPGRRAARVRPAVVLRSE